MLYSSLFSLSQVVFIAFNILLFISPVLVFLGSASFPWFWFVFCRVFSVFHDFLFLFLLFLPLTFRVILFPHAPPPPAAAAEFIRVQLYVKTESIHGEEFAWFCACCSSELCNALRSEWISVMESLSLRRSNADLCCL